EPIGKRPDHATLARSSHIRKPWKTVLEDERNDKHHRHEPQKTERESLHAAQRMQSGEVGGCGGTECSAVDQRHVPIMRCRCAYALTQRRAKRGSLDLLSVITWNNSQHASPHSAQPQEQTTYRARDGRSGGVWNDQHERA